MLRIMIEQKNAAFDDEPFHETARILQHLADQVVNGCVDCQIRDVNGNTVGTMKTTDD